MSYHVLGIFCLSLFAIMIHKIELRFCVYFFIFIHHVVSHFFPVTPMAPVVAGGSA
jgi:hypothetical protein